MNGATSVSAKSKYLDIPDLAELHADCRKWLSEIAFWKDEIAFLKGVPHRYIEKITDENQIINLKFLMGQINGELTEDLFSLEDKTMSLKTIIERLIQNSFIFDEQKSREEYKTLCLRIESFRDSFEQTKAEMKSLMTNVFRKNKTQQA